MGDGFILADIKFHVRRVKIPMRGSGRLVNIELSQECGMFPRFDQNLFGRSSNGTALGEVCSHETDPRI